MYQLTFQHWSANIFTFLPPPATSLTPTRSPCTLNLPLMTSHFKSSKTSPTNESKVWTSVPLVKSLTCFKSFCSFVFNRKLWFLDKVTSQSFTAKTLLLLQCSITSTRSALLSSSTVQSTTRSWRSTCEKTIAGSSWLWVVTTVVVC